jgi:hypothetical protein
VTARLNANHNALPTAAAGEPLALSEVSLSINGFSIGWVVSELSDTIIG